MLSISLKLVLKRLLHSKGVLCCQVLSLAAIMLPLLILMGLKHGFVSGMREQLLRNPATLAVIPHYTEFITEDVVKTMRQWPETGYVLPVVSSLYSKVKVAPVAKAEAASPPPHVSVEMIPTSAGDPVLRASAVAVPGEDEVVLSKRVAESLKVIQGDSVELTLTRNAGQQSLVNTCRVVGVLPLQYEARRVVYVPHAYTVKAQNFSINGETAPYTPTQLTEPVYHALLITPTDDIPADLLENILNQRIEQGEYTRTAKATPATHPGVPEGTLLYERTDRCYTPMEMMALRGGLHGLPVKHTPWVYPQQLLAQLPDKTLPLTVMSDEAPGDISLCEAPPVLRMNYPEANAESHVKLHCVDGVESGGIVCALVHDDSVPKGCAYCSVQLSAVLYRMSKAGSQWDYRTGALYNNIVKFRSVRLYSDSLENTEKLVDRLKQAGVQCTASVNRIRQVLSLEDAFNKLFLIIAGGSGMGALVSFALSLFNAAELHRRDYALTRLLGMGRFTLAFMPLVDALLSTLLAFFISVVAFYASSGIISLLVAKAASNQASLCMLEWQHFVGFGAICCAVAVMASLCAALKVLRITPAEIIRES